MKEQLSDSKSVKILSDACVKWEVKKVVISSGSRNAPLIITFSRRKEIETYTITDERSAAFFALGMAEQLNEPVGLICTSGTAVLNYSPAIAEAYYKGIPLVVMSADRPIERIDQGDGQAIRQEGVLTNFVKETINLPIVDSEDDEWHVRNLLSKAFHAMTSAKKQPIHINIPLKEPLYGTVDYKGDTFFTEIMETQKTLLNEDIENLNTSLNSYNKILILPCIANANEQLNKELQRLSSLPQIVVLTETINNLRDENYFTGVDKYIKRISKEDNEYSPDLLITFGDILISRMIKQYLKERQISHIHISQNAQYIDMFHHLTTRIDVSPEYLLSNIDIKSSLDSCFKKVWENKKAEIEKYHTEYTNKIEWSDYKAFSIIAESIPSDYYIHSGNSTVIRYLQIFPQFSNYRCYCNRGTSGIDGSVSSFVGANAVNEKKNLLIVGDLSFYYDSNALWNRYLNDELKIILINNKGGGIFRFIDGPSKHEELGEFFEHKQERSAEYIAKAFGLDYYNVSDEDNLKKIIRGFMASSKKSILEIKTPREINDKILRTYFEGLV